MKKFVILMSIAITLLYGCSNNQIDDVFESPSVSEGNVTSRSSSDTTSMNWQFIDFVEDESYESQTAVIMIAAERLDKYVSFTGERYIMASCTPEEVGLSQRVFEYMQGLMERQNANIYKYKDWTLVDGKIFEYSEFEYMPPKIASRSETTQPGGITGLTIRSEWYGTVVDVYLSNSILRNAGNSLTVAAVISTAIPNPMAQKVAQAACELASLECYRLANEYPNGVIISVTIVANVVCVPYNLGSQ